VSYVGGEGSEKADISGAHDKDHGPKKYISTSKKRCTIVVVTQGLGSKLGRALSEVEGVSVGKAKATKKKKIKKRKQQRNHMRS